ncbi:beta-propeller domain-containing protein [Patescibacteria group bacterium]|nr:beta-propeller domain-containing protein [Patescibacteria group bacterium]MBU4512766.1 beta-propeller domain-containing protein [Patescibacteria group bacterium]MCG2693105.1 beta-propeller domain-containing protein [Candidatus Parcubacteria bacterium]
MKTENINLNQPEKTEKPNGIVVPAAVLLILIVAFIAGFAVFGYYFVKSQIQAPPTIPAPTSSDFEGLKLFSSEQEFKEYVQASELAYSGGFAWGGGMRSEMMAIDMEAGEAAMAPAASFSDNAQKNLVSTPDRVSETNVQVLGIDEPDIVKTDGNQIYFSKEQVYGWREPMMMEIMEDRKIMPPSESQAATKVIKAFPPADLEVKSSINRQGDLLLYGDMLVVFTYDTIYGYDISDPGKPDEKWKVEYEDNNYLVSARAYGGKIYLVTQQNINRNNPCPIRPISSNGKILEIACTSVYHPVNSVPVDVTYTALIINPDTGNISQDISFVGTSGTSIVYMSTDSLYITYSYYGDFTEFFYNFLIQESDIFPSWVTEKVKKLMDYDISAGSKLSELQVILNDYQNSLSNDDRLKLENELSNRLEDYFDAHKRELEKTGIAKIGLEDFKVQATGVVPGQPLNQFSVDEYNDHLRIATTIGNRFWMFGGNGESANDVYVLDDELKITGSVANMGLTERIYSARFIADMGYIVTFRQTDPFYVLDLSDPKNPQLKGELKIPGYSSYLHPIAKDRILGIGKEDNQVKISLFDVSDPTNPKEASKYTLSEYWSDILNTHHAFLADSKHEIFFLPGSNGGYIFSYASDKLQLEKAISDIRAKRALYINDYLYIIGEDKISVVSEIDWERVNELEL